MLRHPELWTGCAEPLRPYVIAVPLHAYTLAAGPGNLLGFFRGTLQWMCCRGDVQADVEQYREIAKRVLPLVGDTVELINDAWDEGKRILVEGANATMLDLDFGTYPFVTSSNPSIGGVASGLGLAPTKFQAIIGVVRPVCLTPPALRAEAPRPCGRHATLSFTSMGCLLSTDCGGMRGP